MPRKRTKPVLKMSGRTLVLSRDKPPSRWRSIFVLIVSALLLVGLVSWALCSDADEWSGWLGGLKAESSSSSSDGKVEEGDSQARFQGDGYAALGEFSIDRRQQDDSILTVCFKLSGQTICKNQESFRAFREEEYAAFRQHVEGAIRDCQFSALTDEKSLQRKVIVRVNRLLGRHFLEAVEFDELTIYETIPQYATTMWEPEGQDD